MAGWLEVTVSIDYQQAEAVAEELQLFAIADEGVAIEQLGDPDDPAPNALLAQAQVRLFIAAERATERLRLQIESHLHHLQLPAPSYRLLAEEDWANAWKKHYRVLRIGQRTWIRPSWLDPPPAAATDIVLELDPDQAFGTGTHPTTQLCLIALESRLHPGDTVFDVGTGSGILAIAAVKLGAAEVLAIDNDCKAVEVARANSVINKVTLTLRCATLEQVDLQPWRIVVVNILAPTIKTLLHEHSLLDYLAPDGHLILSGILSSQLEDIIRAVEEAGGHVAQVLDQEEWVALIVTKK